MSGTMGGDNRVGRKSRFWRWRGKTTERPQNSWTKYLNTEVTVTKNEDRTKRRKASRDLNITSINQHGGTLDSFHQLPALITFLHPARYEACQQAPSPLASQWVIRRRKKSEPGILIPLVPLLQNYWKPTPFLYRKTQFLLMASSNISSAPSHPCSPLPFYS